MKSTDYNQIRAGIESSRANDDQLPESVKAALTVLIADAIDSFCQGDEELSIEQYAKVLTDAFYDHAYKIA